uniref:hypothetical protein n=1 Tax=Candidatus Oscillochloris fontis TaxID=2496868 RepID=UPI001375E62D
RYGRRKEHDLARKTVFIRTYVLRKVSHIVNRLLRYPVQHPLVYSWVKEAYLANILPERMSEIVALLISTSIPDFVDTSNHKMITWAIYYSRTPQETKEALLKDHLYQDAVTDILDISGRLGLPSVIEALIDRYC